LQHSLTTTMNRLTKLGHLLAVALLALLAPIAPIALLAQSSSKAIDTEVWSVISATVARNDAAGMAATYHPDAVYVGANGTLLIKTQLVKWGKDMADAQKKGDKAAVEFRWSKRQDDAETAFESGVFKYTTLPKSGAGASRYVTFEALLEKHQGKWRMVMEHQIAPTTADVWNRMKP
jgi:uncharacterized protein (TIGR02246 family)